MLNFIKSLAICTVGLFAITGFSQVIPDYQDNYQFYVGTNVGAITPEFVNTDKTFIYSEVKLGYKYDDSLVGVLYHRYPLQLWDFKSEASPHTFGVFCNHSLGSVLNLRGPVNPHVEANLKLHNNGDGVSSKEYILDLHAGVDVRPVKNLVVNASVGVGITHPTEGEVGVDNLNFSSIVKLGLGVVF